MEATLETIWKWDTGYSADSVEWCPVEGFRDVLLCGTYQLEKTETTEDTTGKRYKGEKITQNRLGKIYLFSIDDQATEIEPIQTIETAGILDQKWCYQKFNNKVLVAAVTADGAIQIYDLKKTEEKHNLDIFTKYTIEESPLVLSVDWSTNKIPSEIPKIVVSDSKGGVTLLEFREEKLEKLGNWKAHDFEAWIAAFDYWNPNVFYTGGDDCIFKSWDSRVGAASVTNKQHGAGVTSIRSNTKLEHQILTGSYDETIRLWDTRNLRRPTADLNLGGGIWRLKYHPYNSNYIVAACMYGGFRLIKLDGAGFEVLSEYWGHESIAYGVDWQWYKDGNKCRIATCSFYDCKMHVSDVLNL